MEGQRWPYQIQCNWGKGLSTKTDSLEEQRTLEIPDESNGMGGFWTAC